LKIDDLYQLITGKPIITDTRKIVEGAVFFALKGDNFNGNTFANEALKKGAAYVIIDEADFQISNQTILVGDVLTTLQQLATYHRKKLGIPIIAITGSNGKTTSKELIGAVLAQKYQTATTQGNLNNHIGVPLTLLAMTKSTELGVVEMGSNHPGEIAFLCQIAEPNFGYVTNFGKAHLEWFGNHEGVIKEKSMLYSYLKDHSGQAFINVQDDIQCLQTKNIKAISFNKGEIILKSSNPFVEVAYDSYLIKSKLTGVYNFNNMAAAIAIGHYFKVSTAQIKTALESYEPKNNRSQIIKKGALQIILDAYNANPTSMTLAIENMAQLTENAKYFVLGDMFELGATAPLEHQAIVDALSQLNFEKVYLIGTHFYQTNLKKLDILKFKTFDDFKLNFKPPTKGVLLIKASRGMALERVIDLI